MNHLSYYLACSLNRSISWDFGPCFSQGKENRKCTQTFFVVFIIFHLLIELSRVTFCIGRLLRCITGYLPLMFLSNRAKKCRVLKYITSSNYLIWNEWSTWCLKHLCFLLFHIQRTKILFALNIKLLHFEIITHQSRYNALYKL